MSLSCAPVAVTFPGLPTPCPDCAGPVWVEGAKGPDWVIEHARPRRACSDHARARVRLTGPTPATLAVEYDWQVAPPAARRLHRDMEWPPLSDEEPNPVQVLRRLQRMAGQGAIVDEDLVQWACAGWDDLDDVEQARTAGMTSGVAVANAGGFGRFHPGGDPEAKLPLRPAQTLAWWQATEVEPTLGSFEVAAWLLVGVEWPQDRPVGLSPRDATVLAGAGARDLGAHWAGVGALCPDMVRHGVEAGRSAAEMIAVFTALRPDRAVEAPCHHLLLTCEWNEEDVAVALRAAQRVKAMDWFDVAACLRTGMTVTGAIEHIRAGREMGPVRLLAALGH